MYRLGHLPVLVLATAAILPGAVQAHARNPQPYTLSFISQSQQDAQADGVTTIHLRWGARQGVSRYRLQVAADRGFQDIVFDRVVAGTDYQINDLAPGTYFWRIAPLTRKLGEFSSAAAIEVTRQGGKTNTQLEPPASRPDKAATNDSTRSKPVSNSVTAGGGWRAAVGEVTHPVLAHLRSANGFDVVALNAEGVTVALDANGGVALWSSGRGRRDAKSMRPGLTRIAPLAIKARSGLEDVAIVSGVTVTRINGATGRELWRSALPSLANTAAVLSEKRGSEIFVIDNSLQMLFIVDGNAGNIVAQIRLPRRVAGAPVAFDDRGVGRMMLAFDNGQIEVRDRAGALISSGDAGSPATTPPLFVDGSRGGLILVGTRSGLTALGAHDLRALGRVALNGDAPRGTLAAEDLNGDGTAEVIMFTDRDRVLAVNAADGKILWESAGGIDADAAAFADINADGVLDVLTAGGQGLALALSGRDGSLIWQDDESSTSAANHAASLASRRVVAIRSGSRTLLIAGDPSRTGLRAIEFSRRSTKQ